MLLRNLRSRLFTSYFQQPRRPIRRSVQLRVEQLDARINPSITFDPIHNYTFPGGKDLYVPLTAVESQPQSILFSAQSSNSGVTASVVNGGVTVKLNVSGTDGSGNPFTGDLTIRLFDSTPLAEGQISTLVNNGFYKNKLFHRIISGFMAQAGSANGNGTGTSGLGSFEDEFNKGDAFVSPGLVAMANAGDDTNDSQFFIVDTSLSLAQEPQHLNYDYTVVGLLVDGFDTFTKLLSAKVHDNGQGEVSAPDNPVTINSATIVPDDENGVLRVHADSGFVGDSTVTVRATSLNGVVEQSFTASSVADTLNDRPFLGDIANVTVNPGSPVTITLPATDVNGDSLTYVARDPSNLSNPAANVNVAIDNATGKATITPKAGFTGSVDIEFGVRDQTDRSGTGSLDDQSVGDDITLDTASDTGLSNSDNYTTVDTPSLTVHTTAGATVAVSVNGQGSFTATESSTPGVYTITLPKDTLQVGNNTITATVAALGQPATQLTPLTINYAPSQTNVFVVPGAPGSAQQVNFSLFSAEALFKSEAGFFVVDDSAGRIGTLLPSDPGYAKAALARAQMIVSRTQGAGASNSFALTGGQFVGFYLIQNSSLATWKATNPNNNMGGVLAFFSFVDANPDHFAHLASTGDASDGLAVFGWEDGTHGGDKDYNDRVITAKLVGASAPMEAISVPAGPALNVSIQFQLQAAVKSMLGRGTAPTSTGGEVGIFQVDSPDGRIGNLMPGQPGYAQAALAIRQTLFAAGASAGQSGTVNLPGGALFGVYQIDNGSAANLLTSNPTNSAAGTEHAFFSFKAANPDSVDHFRNFDPEGAAQAVPGSNAPLQIHGMSKLNGTSKDFDDFQMNVTFTAAP
jgi:cyclophilin family peptidyl-prolyl cis-trans isomerase